MARRGSGPHRCCRPRPGKSRSPAREPVSKGNSIPPARSGLGGRVGCCAECSDFGAQHRPTPPNTQGEAPEERQAAGGRPCLRIPGSPPQRIACTPCCCWDSRPPAGRWTGRAARLSSAPWRACARACDRTALQPAARLGCRAALQPCSCSAGAGPRSTSPAAQDQGQARGCRQLHLQHLMCTGIDDSSPCGCGRPSCCFGAACRQSAGPEGQLRRRAPPLPPC